MARLTLALRMHRCTSPAVALVLAVTCLSCAAAPESHVVRRRIDGTIIAQRIPDPWPAETRDFQADDEQVLIAILSAFEREGMTSVRYSTDLTWIFGEKAFPGHVYRHKLSLYPYGQRGTQDARVVARSEVRIGDRVAPYDFTLDHAPTPIDVLDLVEAELPFARAAPNGIRAAVQHLRARDAPDLITRRPELESAWQQVRTQVGSDATLDAAVRTEEIHIVWSRASGGARVEMKRHTEAQTDKFRFGLNHGATYDVTRAGQSTLSTPLPITPFVEVITLKY